MQLVELDALSGGPFWINPNHVFRVTPNPKNAQNSDVYYSGGPTTVKGDQAAIAKKLNDGLKA